MKILLIGSGKLGATLSRMLVDEGHDVTVVDRSDEAVQRGLDTTDALYVKGNGVSTQTLLEADVQHADILIAATASDEINMLCCLNGKRLGADYTIARIRDPEYLSSLDFLQKELSIDYVINPERTTAREISRMLRFPFAATVESFAKGRVEMIDFRANENDPFVNIPVREVFSAHPRLPRVLFSFVQRGDQSFIPKGDSVILPGDLVYVVGHTDTVTAFFTALGRGIAPIRSVMIMGGSRIAFYLATLLSALHIKTSIIEVNRDHCRFLSEELPEADIIFGDGTDQELLENEGLPEADAFITLSDRDEENMMAGLYAVQRGVKKIIIKSGRDNYSSVMHSVGLDSVISPKNIASNYILRTVRGRANRSSSSMERMYKLINGQAEALEFIANEGENYLHRPLKDLDIDRSCLIAVIVRDGIVMVPFGSDTIEAGDHVIVVSSRAGISALNQVIRR